MRARQKTLSGEFMRDDWIFDVLTDLKAYAVAHGMPALARKADEALDAARAESGSNRDSTPEEVRIAQVRRPQ
jgi:hypothetical protein